MSESVIVTAAITGNVHTPSMTPYLPITPQQIADEALRSYEAGAAIAHVHVRQPDTGKPVHDVELVGEVLAKIKSRCNMIVCVSTGSMDASVERRLASVRAYGMELASYNAGSMNFGLFPGASRSEPYKFEWERPYLEASEDTVFPNTFKTLREYAAAFREQGTKPELEVYDLGMISNIAFLLQNGHLQRPPHIQFVLGILGGAPANLDNLLFFYNTARAAIGDFTWSVCAAGRFQMPICTGALLMGGHCRVGLEDAIFLERGVMAKSNAEQVAKIVRIAKELGREPATPDEARQILGLKGLDKVRY
ncbi:MAG: 3-keto-5-aminohexanoate cleavage protein [Chloroflexi bacterium]|nr:3-keto-5-aminohexanoate cleavage protein [Chloroflexota bacterium]